MTGSEFEHKPVLLGEVIECLNLETTGTYVDCTFGRGGYSKEILDKLGKEGLLLALDTDPDAIEYGARVFKDESRLKLIHSNYDRVAEIIKERTVSGEVNGIVFDLGVSSPQLEDATRGFSFRNEGPLDMRMNPETGQSAKEWINTATVADIKYVFRRYGEEPLASRIANYVVQARARQAINSTRELADIVFQAFPEKERRKRKLHPATKVFQAIRMHVNDELTHLQTALHAAVDTLAAGATLVVVSFHSLEDRIVKRLFRDLVQGELLPDKLPVKDQQIKRNFEYACKLLRPSDKEIDENRRSRSARLRAVRKLL